MLLRVSLKRLNCWPDFKLPLWRIMVSKLPLCSISVHIDKDILFFFFLFYCSRCYYCLSFNPIVILTYTLLSIVMKSISLVGSVDDVAVH